MTNLRSRADLRRAVAFLCEIDAELAAVVARFGIPPMWSRHPGFATLVRIILEQQVSLASAARAYERLQVAAGRITPANILEVGSDGMREAGLTRQKAGYCLSLADHVASGKLDLRTLVTKHESCVRKKLRVVPGIGDWTVDIFLLLAVRHPNIWPVGDLALAKALQQIKGLQKMPSREDQGRIAAQWSPFRSAAARIHWHYYLSIQRRS